MNKHVKFLLRETINFFHNVIEILLKDISSILYLLTDIIWKLCGIVIFIVLFPYFILEEVFEHIDEQMVKDAKKSIELNVKVKE